MSYGGKAGGLGDGGGGGGGGGERDTESKYEQLYEADLDPFKEFDSRECFTCMRTSTYVLCFVSSALSVCSPPLGFHAFRVSTLAAEGFGSTPCFCEYFQTIWLVFCLRSSAVHSGRKSSVMYVRPRARVGKVQRLVCSSSCSLSAASAL